MDVTRCLWIELGWDFNIGDDDRGRMRDPSIGDVLDVVDVADGGKMD